MNCPSNKHQAAAKRVLRYLAGSVGCGLWYSTTGEGKLEGYSDSDWGGCMEDRKSTTGFVFKLGTGAVSWMSKKQDIVALSTTEAEYIALCSAACQNIWLNKVMKECSFTVDEEPRSTTTIWCDNISCIVISKNPVMHGRTKHIDIKYHFIRGLITEGNLIVKHCNTNDQLADIFTKSLPSQKHHMFKEQLGVCDLQLRGDDEL